MTKLVKGDIFVIQVLNNDGEVIGYVNARLNRKEWVLYVSTESLKFELLSFEDSGNINKNIFPIVKALLPSSSISGGNKIKEGDYILGRGSGGEFNPLLFGTTEYNWKWIWLISPTIGAPWVDMQTDFGFYIDSSSNNEFLKIISLLQVDASYTSNLKIVRKKIWWGPHFRPTEVNQLRFGVIGDAQKMFVKFFKVEL